MHRRRRLSTTGGAPSTSRLQKTLEDANIKVAGLISDLLGTSGRALLGGLIGGEADPEALFARTTGLLRADPDHLRAALEGRVREHHRFLLDLHLTQIMALEDGLRSIDARLTELSRPYTATIARLCSMPGWGRSLPKRWSPRSARTCTGFRRPVICGPGSGSALDSTRVRANGDPPGFVTGHRG